MKSERQNPSAFSIGALAAETGTPIETIRYYERAGVLPRARRSSGGYRLYNAGDAQRLRFIRRARELGFSLQQARELAELSRDPTQRCDGICRIAAAHLVEVEDKIRQLAEIRRELSKLAKCEGGRVSACRIVDALETRSS
ncbi:MAG: MerR family transcriptional regulator [Gemmatimonadaceae bacterium]